jgi:hypothetical protein
LAGWLDLVLQQGEGFICVNEIIQALGIAEQWIQRAVLSGGKAAGEKISPKQRPT